MEPHALLCDACIRFRHVRHPLLATMHTGKMDLISFRFTSSVNSYHSSASVEARGQFVAAGRSIGNENRRWHGTRRECTLGDKGNTQMCGSQTCSLCCIVRTSFDLSLWGKKTGWGRYVFALSQRQRHLMSTRFGKGIYTSSTSSK